MTRPVEFRPDAADEFAAAAAWYEARRTGLGSEFVSAIEAGLTEIAASPARHPVVHADVHRLLARRFPYAILYRLLPDRIRVIAVFHSARDPGALRGRL